LYAHINYVGDWGGGWAGEGGRRKGVPVHIIIRYNTGKTACTPTEM